MQTSIGIFTYQTNPLDLRYCKKTSAMMTRLVVTWYNAHEFLVHNAMFLPWIALQFAKNRKN